MIREIRKLFHFLKPYWLLSILSLILLAVMVVLELSIPRLIQKIIDEGIRQNDMSVVLKTSFLMLGISIFSAIFAVLNSVFSIRVGENVASDIRKAIFEKVQQFSYGNLDRFSTGLLMIRLTSDTSAVQRVVQISLRIGTRGPLLMIGSIILMFRTSRTLALSMLPLLIISGGLIILFSIKMEPGYRLVQQKLDQMNTVLQENISGARLIKSFLRADFENDRFGTVNQDFSDSTIHVMQFLSVMSPVLTLMVQTGMVLVIWLGGIQSIQGSLSLGQLIAFVNYLLATLHPLTMLVNLSNIWANGIASAKRINEVLDTEPDIKGNSPHIEKEVTQRDDSSTAITDNNQRNTHRVIFENVDFYYNGNADVQVLQNICLEAKTGQTVAILGATGSGKTSLVNLIPRFYDTSAGSVLVDGINVRALTEDDLLNRISIVPQETILFSGTIRDNICFGRPDASDEDMIAAAKAAQAHDFIMNFSSGYETRVEERGGNLSGGQKQRIAIARALITEPDILILDDSTSAVDVETETKIQAALQKLMRGKTSFVVAQRISTVLNVDKIIVLDRGRIAAEGSHAELMEHSRIYQEIFASQLGGGIHEL
jgi:ATP-binding cassette subfamily B multidrug efflux pump